MSGTPVSLGSVLLPVILFVGAGFSLGKAYDAKRSKSKMWYFWALMLVIFVGGGYYTLTKGVSATNLRNMTRARINAIRGGGGAQATVAPVAQPMQPQMIPV